MNNKEDVEKNLEVVSKELHSYWFVLQTTWDRLKTTDRKFHVAAGILPDTFRTLPRTLSYIVYLSLIAVAFVAIWSMV
jgi:hypothetical protein